MMDLPIPVKDNIISSYKDNNAYVFETERGLLKVSFIKDNLVHVCFSPSRKFREKQEWILDGIDDIAANMSEDNDNYKVSCGNINVVIDKTNSSIKYIKSANDSSKEICNRLIDIEEQLRNKLYCYL